LCALSCRSLSLSPFSANVWDSAQQRWALSPRTWGLRPTGPLPNASNMAEQSPALESLAAEARIALMGHL